MPVLKRSTQLVNYILQSIDSITTPGIWQRPMKGEATTKDICKQLEEDTEIRLGMKLTPRRLSFILEDSGKFQKITRIDPRVGYTKTFWRRK